MSHSNPGHGATLVTSGVPTLGTTFKRGEQWVWLAGASLATALILIAGLLWIVLENGASSAFAAFHSTKSSGSSFSSATALPPHEMSGIWNWRPLSGSR